MTLPNFEICFICILLAPLANAGLMLIHQGLGRSRSAAHAMLSSLCALAVAAIVTVVIGAGVMGSKGGAFFSFQLGGVSWNWCGRESLLGGNSHVANATGAGSALSLCLQIFACALAATIPLSAGSDRWRLAPICASTALFAAITYPMFAHWVWSGGWLAQFGSIYKTATFQDIGGAGVIQTVGGLTALSVAWILRPRRGKYTPDCESNAIPAHNIVQVLFGCMIALVGWTGLECASSILWNGASAFDLVSVAINTVLCASSGCLAAVAVTQFRYRKPDASLAANGWIGGLVAGSAGCGVLSPLAAIATGALAGLIVLLLIEMLEFKFLIDDPGGSISVHAGAGIWGLISFSIFGRFADGQRGEHILAQLVGVATLLGIILPWIHGVNSLLNRILPYRVDREGDSRGMDIRELGAGAYPEFVVHSDEHMRR